MEPGLAPDTPLGRLMNAGTLALAGPGGAPPAAARGRAMSGVIQGLGDGVMATGLPVGVGSGAWDGIQQQG